MNTNSSTKLRNTSARRHLNRLLGAALISPAILMAVYGAQAQAGQLGISAFQTYVTGNAAGIQPGPLALYAVSLNSIAPTQMNEGLTEVGKKTAGFDLLAPGQLQANLLTDIEPVVIGPGGQLYLTDGHHTFTALSNSIYGASNPTVYVNVIANYSNLTTAQFFAQMQAKNFLLPLNDGVPQTVNTATGAPIPTSLTALTSDPYRGLEYSILKNKSSALFPTTNNITGAIGSSIPGLDKMTGFYSDFFEAEAYRNAKGGLGLAYLSPGDVALATAWNLNGASTTTLPNVAGTVTAAQLPGFILSQNIVNAGGISNTTLANGALDGNGAFTGITTINAGTPSAPITIGTPNVGLIMQLGADNKDTVTLNGTNTYTGGTSILAGTLIAASDASLGAAPTGAIIDTTAVKTSVQAANGIVFNSLTEGAGTLTFGTTTGGSFTTSRPIAVGGEVATLSVNGNAVTLNGQIVSLGVSGTGIGNATGFSDLTIDDLSTPDNGVLNLNTASPNFFGNLIIGNTGTPTVNVTSDAALGATTGSAAAIGQIDLNSGTLQAGASFAAPERNIFLGSGSQFDVNGFTTSWGTLTNVQRTLEILNSSTTHTGAVIFNNFTIGSTAILQLAGGTMGESTTFTNGIVRTGPDTLILNPSSGSSLGTTEQIFSGTGAASLTGGIAPVWIVTNNGVAKGAGPYDFVTYGAGGYVKATYNATTLTGATGSNVIALAANTTAAGNVSAFALNTEGKTIALGGNTLTIGDGTNPAGLILATGSQINNGTLAFGGSNGVIWLSGTTPTISASLTGSNGLTFAGSGAVALSTAANVSGAITIDSGTVTLSGANIFAGDISGVTLSNDKKQPAPATLAISANNTLTTINAGSNAAINISNGAVLTLGDSTNNLGSVIGATFKETNAATAGALTLNGSGLFDFTGGSKAAFGLVSGSTIVVNNSAQLRAAANEFVAGTGIVLNGTSQLQLAENGGQVLGNTISGTGALHLIGGTLLLTGTGNTYSGGTIVETGSTLDITTANLPAINPNITNAGGLVLFDQATNGNYAGVISDGKEMGTGPMLAGSLDKDDSTGANGGNVTIAQAQTFSGATTVEAGTLTLGAVDTLATSSGVDLGRVGGGSTATLALAANNTIKALSSEASDTTAVTLGANTLTLASPSGGVASYGGAITGAGSVVKNGSGAQAFTGAVTPGGALTVNAGILDFGNGGTLTTPTVTVNGGTLEFDRGSTLSTTTVSVAHGATFEAIGGSTTPSATNFGNSGVLDVRNGSANNTFTIGAYTGVSGSQLVVGVNDTAQTADRLVVASAAGSTQIVLSDPTPNTPAPYDPAGMPVVVSTAALDPQIFTLANAPIQKGLFQYDLAHNATEALLTSTPNGEAFRVADVPTATQSIWNDTADVIMDHQGGQHGLMDNPAAGEQGVWARAFGDWNHRDETQDYSNLSNSYAFQTGYSQDTSGLFAGYDSPRRAAGAGDATSQIGIVAGFVTSTLDFKDSTTRPTFQGFSLGVTGDYVNHDLFMDGAAKVDLLNLDYTAHALGSFGPAPQNDLITSYGAIADVGYRMGMGQMAYIAPLAGLGYVSAHVDGLSLAGSQVAFGNNDTLRGRLGLDAGATLSDSGERRLEATFNASYWSRLSGGSAATIDSGAGAPLLTITDQQVTSYGDVGGALTSTSLSGGWSAFVQGDYKFASDFNGGSVKVGVRRNF